MPLPDFEAERSIHKQGFRLIAGVDEVGRGCLAGPVVAAAVILNPEKIPKGLNDSKLLSPKKREELNVIIRETALCFAIGVGEVEEIDRINIFNSSKMAMIRAVKGLAHAADFLLIDGNFTIPIALKQQFIIQGDQKSVSIAAASIVAKVFRDKMMTDFETQYPGYDFASNKGYGSLAHRKALGKQGECPIHRKSFEWTPV